MPGIEQTIRFLKYQTGSLTRYLLNKGIPRRMRIDMAKFVVLWFDEFLVVGGVSNTISHREVITGTKLYFKRYCKVVYRAYYQT